MRWRTKRTKKRCHTREANIRKSYPKLGLSSGRQAGGRERGFNSKPGTAALRPLVIRGVITPSHEPHEPGMVVEKCQEKRNHGECDDERKRGRRGCSVALCSIAVLWCYTSSTFDYDKWHVPLVRIYSGNRFRHFSLQFARLSRN
jgi:hypothetical protein